MDTTENTFPLLPYPLLRAQLSARTEHKTPVSSQSICSLAGA
jgi:hypothetical protein